MKDSKISWTHHTFNPWWGCVKVSDGCKHCYADTFSKRYGHDIWGVDKPRRFFGDKHWNEPVKWNREAEKAGERRRVFCASMADVFEDRADLDEPRARLFELIRNTESLDWLLLTKRPENIKPLMQRIPVLKRDNLWDHVWTGLDGLGYTRHFRNVWLGTTCEDINQVYARGFALLKVPAAIRFLSCEPLLGPLNFGWQKSMSIGIDWVIVGGESGHGARPMNVEWARSIKDQCLDAGVPFFMKQMGGTIDKRHDLEDLPEDLRIRQWPTVQEVP